MKQAVGKTFSFSFSLEGWKKPIHTLLTVPKKAPASLTFNLVTSVGSFISAINVHTEPKLKNPQAKVVRPQAETLQLTDVQQFDHEDLEAEAAFEDAPYAGSASAAASGAGAAKAAKDGKEKEKKKPWYKEYVNDDHCSSGISSSEASSSTESHRSTRLNSRSRWTRRDRKPSRSKSRNRLINDCRSPCSPTIRLFARLPTTSLSSILQQRRY